jgi:hypothetical protein
MNLLTTARAIVILLALSVLFAGCMPVDSNRNATFVFVSDNPNCQTVWLGYYVCEIELRDGTSCVVTASGGIACDWTGARR